MDDTDCEKNVPSSTHFDLHPEYIPVLSNILLAKRVKESGISPLLEADEMIKEKRRDEDEPKKLRPCIMDIQTAAKIFMQTKKFAKRTRSKSSKATKYLKKKQSDFESELFTNYNLTEMHHKIHSHRRENGEYLQKMILDQMPKSSTSVKDRITNKINVLERMRDHTFIMQSTLDSKPDGSDSGDGGSSIDAAAQCSSRRHRKVRRSLDQCHVPIPDSDSNTTPRMADIDRALAVMRTRGKIEEDLDLPCDRLARLTTLRRNVARIDKKFKSLLKDKRGDGDRKNSVKLEEEKLYLTPSRFTQPGMVSSSIIFHQFFFILVIVIFRFKGIVSHFLTLS